MSDIVLQPLPPKEAIAFFRQKGFKIGFNHQDVWQEEHQAAFTVAKAMSVDVLKAIRSAVDDALANGTTFRDFRKNLKPVLQQKGWWGQSEMIDPLDGQKKQVQLGSTRRLELIYDTNLRTSYSEGKWQRIQANKGAFPYLMYSGGHSAHPRPLHLAWNGLVLPADDPFWQAHYPVKAWRCKCYVIQMNSRMLARQGLSVGSAPKVESYTYINKRTGEVQKIPAGVDPAFHYAPGGRQGALNSYLASTLDSADRPLAAAAVSDLVKSAAFKSFYEKPEGAFPVAVLAAADAKALGAGTNTVRLSDATMQKQIEVHPEITWDEYGGVQEAIDKGELIQDSDNTAIYLWEDGGYVTVVKATKSGKALYMTSFRRLSRDEVKRDEEVKRLLKKKQ